MDTPRLAVSLNRGSSNQNLLIIYFSGLFSSDFHLICLSSCCQPVNTVRVRLPVAHALNYLVRLARLDIGDTAKIQFLATVSAITSDVTQLGS